MNPQQQQIVFAGAALFCAGMGTFYDLRQGRIPNRVTGPAILVGLAIHWIAGGPRGLADSTLAGVIAGAIFLVFFLAGGMGGGDVKLMAAVGCISGLSHLGLIVIATAIAGGVFAIVVSLRHGRLRETVRNAAAVILHHSRRGLEPHPDVNLSNTRMLRLPFALPIAAGCLLAVCITAWEACS